MLFLLQILVGLRQVKHIVSRCYVCLFALVFVVECWSVPKRGVNQNFSMPVDGMNHMGHSMKELS